MPKRGRAEYYPNGIMDVASTGYVQGGTYFISSFYDRKGSLKDGNLSPLGKNG